MKISAMQLTNLLRQLLAQAPEHRHRNRGAETATLIHIDQAFLEVHALAIPVCLPSASQCSVGLLVNGQHPFRQASAQGGAFSEWARQGMERPVRQHQERDAHEQERAQGTGDHASECAVGHHSDAQPSSECAGVVSAPPRPWRPPSQRTQTRSVSVLLDGSIRRMLVLSTDTDRTRSRRRWRC
jgi:hypothetical protein